MALIDLQQDGVEETTVETQLNEMHPGLSTRIDLKVIWSKIVEYTYPWQGKETTTQKLTIGLQSKIPDQYCLGIAKLAKNKKAELKKLAERWQIGSTWRFIGLVLTTEKTAYIHTTCRIAVDLRKAKVENC